MAIIGSLGDTLFIVTSTTVQTFNNMKWDSSAKYAEHDRHLKDPLLEFTGNDADRITFDMFFSIFLGVDPLWEIGKLLATKRDAKANFLVIGSKRYGRHKWVIKNLTIDLKNFDNKGRMMIAKVSISLVAYAER